MKDSEHKWELNECLKMIPALVVAIIIFSFSSLSNPYPVPPIKSILLNLNNLLHIGEFGLLTLLIFIGFFPKVKSYYLLLFSFSYAFLDEVHQFFVPSRYFDIIDFSIDAIGVIGGFLTYFLFKFLLVKIKAKD
jgi:VanZ family protein